MLKSEITTAPEDRKLESSKEREIIAEMIEEIIYSFKNPFQRIYKHLEYFYDTSYTNGSKYKNNNK